MNHREVTELLGAYALDAVDDDERAVVEDHLPTCARCRAEVEEHREVAALLAHSGGAAPAGVWDRITASLEEAPPRLRLAPVEDDDDTRAAPRRPSDGRRGLPSRIAVAALAAAAAVVVALGVQVRQQDQRIDELQAALQEPLVPAFQDAVDDPGSRLMELTSADGNVVVRGVVTTDGIGYVRATGLPRLDADRTYQLWGAAGDQLISLGVLGADPGIVSFPAHPYELFAITEEAAPGVIVSANPPVVAGGLA